MKDIDMKMGSTVYGRIAAARLTERERQVAINAMRNGEAIADAIYGVVHAFASLRNRAFHRPAVH